MTATLSETIAKSFIDEANQKINEIERKRYSLPDINLTDTEIEVLKAIVQGRNRNEMDAALHANNLSSYNSYVYKLMDKFEAFTLAHVVYKAMKMGIID